MASVRLHNFQEIFKHEVSKLHPYLENEFEGSNVYETEREHVQVYTRVQLMRWVRALPQLHLWNVGMCLFVLYSLVAVFIFSDSGLFLYIDLAYNLLYLLYVFGFILEIYSRHNRIGVFELFRFILDAVSYTRIMTRKKLAVIIFYTIRLNKPLEYLCTLKNYEMKGSVYGTIFKWLYIFIVIQLLWTTFLLMSGLVMEHMYVFQTSNDSYSYIINQILSVITIDRFMNEYVEVLEMFIPLGAQFNISNLIDQLLSMFLVMMGSLLVRGVAVSSLALVMAMYKHPAQQFRNRYRLIMKDLALSRKYKHLYEKVEIFYKKFWEKHDAINEADLIQVLPPSLRKDINNDVYFDAIQKLYLSTKASTDGQRPLPRVFTTIGLQAILALNSLILRDLPSHFTAEISTAMTTVHYIPGDMMIRRDAYKESLIFITYGDVEVLTPEDDSSPMLRLSRGSVLSACSGCCAVGSARSHVRVVAATYCTAQVLHAPDLWRLLGKGKYQGMTKDINTVFNEKLRIIKKHYAARPHPKVKLISSIYYFKLGIDLLQHTKKQNGELFIEQNTMLEIAGCYRIRNNQDIHDPVCLRGEFPCILQPSSTVLDAWDILIVVCTVIITVVHPYVLVFKEERSLSFLYFDQLMFVLFVIDLAVYLSTGANIEEGFVVTSGLTALYRTKHKRFIMDVVAVVPIFSYVCNGEFGGINRLAKLPKVFRYLERLESKCVLYSEIIRLIYYSTLLATTVYLIAAVHQAVMCTGFDSCELIHIGRLPHWGKEYASNVSWSTDIREWRRIYFGVYWSMTLLTLTNLYSSYVKGFKAQTLYTIGLIMFATLFYIFFESAYSATILVTTASSKEFVSAISQITGYFDRNKINKTVQQRFIQYLELCWGTDEAYGLTHRKQSIFYDLPQNVYEEIVAKQNTEYIMTIPFMKYISKGDLKFLASKLKLFYTSPNEIILNTGDVTKEFYILKQGMCEILSPLSKTVIDLVRPKGNFGVIDCILGLPVFYTIRAVTHVQIYKINIRHFKSILKTPRFEDAIFYIKHTRQYVTLVDRHWTPFVVYEPLPKPPNICKFRLPKKYEKDDAFQNPFTQLGYFSMLRYVFPRFTIRPDGAYLWHYEWFRAACALASSFLFPAYSYLSIQFQWLIYIRTFLDLSAYFDILQRLLIAYYNEDGVLVSHPASTAAHYIRTAFTLDLLACLPLETLEPLRLQSATEKYKYIGYVVVVEHQFLMHNRLLQLYRFFTTIDRLSWRRDLVFVLKFIIIYMAMCNVLASSLVLVTLNIFFTDFTDFGRYWVIDSIQIEGVQRLWLDVYDNYQKFRFNLSESPWNIHLATLSWSVYETSTTGYEYGIRPSAFNHLAALTIGCFCSKMLTTFFSVRVISFRATVNKALCTFRKQMWDLKLFMENEGFDTKLQRKITKYFEHSWDKTGGVDSRLVLKMCEQVSLRTDTILQIYGPTFYECPILTGCDTSLLRILSRSICDIYFWMDTEIIMVDDVLSFMYIINNGSVDIQGYKEGKIHSIPLRRGSVFGNLDKFPIRTPARAVSTSNVHLLQIKTDIFYNVIADFPEVLVRLDKLRPHRECYISTATSSVKMMKFLRKQKRRARYAMELLDILETKFWSKNPIFLFYMIVISLLSIYNELYLFGFQGISTKMLITSYLLDLLFFIKLPILMIVPPGEESKIKKKIKEIRKKYMKHEFIYDVISLLPIETPIFATKPMDWQAFSWLRLNRLFRIRTIYVSLHHYRQKTSINMALTTLLSILIWFCLAIHAFTCFLFYITRIIENEEPMSSWRFNRDKTIQCVDQYFCASFFVVSTFTLNGIGHLLPQKHVEIIYVIFVIMIAKMFYMIIMGEFASIMLYRHFRVFEYYNQCSQLKKFLNNHNVSKNLMNVVSKYLRHLWHVTRGIQMPENVVAAPPAISRMLMVGAFYKHLKNHAVFKICETAFLYQLVQCFQLYYYVEDMFLVRENEVTDSMYFVHSGCVEESSERVKSKRYFTAGQCFGSGLVRNQPFRFTYRTTTYSQILILHMDLWEQFLKFYPRSKVALYGQTDDGDDNDFYQGYFHFDSGDQLLPTLSNEMMTASKIEEAYSELSMVSSDYSLSLGTNASEFMFEAKELKNILQRHSNEAVDTVESHIQLVQPKPKKEKDKDKLPKSEPEPKYKHRRSFFSTQPFKLKRMSITEKKVTEIVPSPQPSLSETSIDVEESHQTFEIPSELLAPPRLLSHSNVQLKDENTVSPSNGGTSSKQLKKETNQHDSKEKGDNKPDEVEEEEEEEDNVPRRGNRRVIDIVHEDDEDEDQNDEGKKSPNKN